MNLSLLCKKLSPAFIGPFTIRSLLGTNAVRLNYSERFQLLNPTVNIAYLRPYRLRTSDIGPPPKSLSANPFEVELHGSSWYQVEDILDHRASAGPMCDCLVRWKDFDVMNDSWVSRKLLVSHMRICPVLQVMVVTRCSRTQIVGLFRQPTLLSLQLRRRPMLCLSLPLREKRLLLFLHLQGGSFVDPHSTEIQDVNT